MICEDLSYILAAYWLMLVACKCRVCVTNQVALLLVTSVFLCIFSGRASSDSPVIISRTVLRFVIISSRLCRILLQTSVVL